MNTTTTTEGAGEFPLTDEQLSAIAYKGFDDYWTEDCAGKDAEAWAASAKAVIVALRAQAAEGEPSAPEAAPAGDAYQKALELRIAQGWQLGGNACPVLYTDTINGDQVCRDDLWLATTAGLKGAPAPRSSPMSNKTVCGSRTGECERQAPAPASEAVGVVVLQRGMVIHTEFGNVMQPDYLTASWFGQAPSNGTKLYAALQSAKGGAE